MTALETSTAYFLAWTGGRPDDAWRLLADDVTCHGPAGTLVGRDAVAAFMGPFATSLTNSSLIAHLADDDHTALFYDTSNPAVASAPAAELHTVHEGQIVEIHILFDRLPFALARGDGQDEQGWAGCGVRLDSIAAHAALLCPDPLPAAGCVERDHGLVAAQIAELDVACGAHGVSSCVHET